MLFLGLLAGFYVDWLGMPCTFYSWVIGLMFPAVLMPSWLDFLRVGCGADVAGAWVVVFDCLACLVGFC